jgi:hypothetical protein
MAVVGEFVKSLPLIKASGENKLDIVNAPPTGVDNSTSVIIVGSEEATPVWCRDLVAHEAKE